MSSGLFFLCVFLCVQHPVIFSLLFARGVVVERALAALLEAFHHIPWSFFMSAAMLFLSAIYNKDPESTFFHCYEIK